MRCKSCNKILTDFESTRKAATTGDYIDLCNGCFSYIKDDVDVLERFDLTSEDDWHDEDDDSEWD